VSNGVDGRIGEAWAGEVPNGSHVNLVIARRGTATAAAAVGALGSPRAGHAPFLACLGAGNLVRPATIVVNKTTIDSDRLAKLTWGAAQLGIAQGVLDAVADEALDPDLVLLVALWVDPEAHDETALRIANREAIRAAIADALDPGDPRALAARREDAANAFYTGD
jgi:5,6,7,8-tetrahydromethanopterin hydro-lyase